MIKLFRLATLTIFAVCAMSTGAIASSHKINKKGADELKALLEKTLDDYKAHMLASMGTSNGAKFETTGELTVEPADGYYAATLPSLSFIVPVNTVDDEGKQEEAMSSKFDIGMVAINAIPSKEKGVWTLAVAFPDNMHVSMKPTKEGASEVSFDLSVGDQRNYTVLWDSNLDARWGIPFSGVLSAKTDWRDIVLTTKVGQQEPVDLNVASLVYNQDYNLDKKGLVSGDFGFELSGISYEFSDTNDLPTKAGVDGIKVSGKIDGADADKIAKFYKSFLIESAKLNEELEAGKKASKENTLASFDAGVGLYTNILSSIDVSYSVDGISFEQALPNGSKNEFKLKSAAFKSNFVDVNTDKSFVEENISYSGLDISPKPFGIYSVMPTDGSFNIAFNNIPTTSLLAILRDLIGREFDAGQGGGSVDTQDLKQKALAVLVDAGASIKVSDTEVGNDVYSSVLLADIKPSTKSPIGVLLNSKLTFKGLDALVAAVSKEMQDAASETSAGGALPIIMGAGQAQSMGKKTEGKDEYIYVLEIGEDGAIKLNGLPLGG